MKPKLLRVPETHPPQQVSESDGPALGLSTWSGAGLLPVNWENKECWPWGRRGVVHSIRLTWGFLRPGDRAGLRREGVPRRKGHRRGVRADGAAGVLLAREDPAYCTLLASQRGHPCDGAAGAGRRRESEPWAGGAEGGGGIGPPRPPPPQLQTGGCGQLPAQVEPAAPKSWASPSCLMSRGCTRPLQVSAGLQPAGWVGG